MAKRGPKYTQSADAKDRYRVRQSFFEKFDSGFIGLGDLTTRKQTFEGLAVIVDLKDFTSFCDQRDSHNAVPEFLNRFLRWLFNAIRDEMLESRDAGDVVLWFHLPIFGKFLGDGVLLLWDVSDMSNESRGTVVRAFDIICNDYERVFLKDQRHRFTMLPTKLRCGIAQGLVTSIAGGRDYIGMCINIASRLQKLAENNFSFGFTKTGLEQDEESDWYEDFRLIKFKIRGIEREEFIYVLKREFKSLSKEDKRKYRV